jgi:hypothetical protein
MSCRGHGSFRGLSAATWHRERRNEGHGATTPRPGGRRVSAVAGGTQGLPVAIPPLRSAASRSAPTLSLITRSD